MASDSLHREILKRAAEAQAVKMSLHSPQREIGGRARVDAAHRNSAGRYLHHGVIHNLAQPRR
jgi:hypothetical protein